MRERQRAEHHLCDAGRFTTIRAWHHGGEISTPCQLAETLGREGRVAVVLSGVLARDVGGSASAIDDTALALRLRVKRGGVRQAVSTLAGTAARTFFTSSTIFALSGKPPSRYIECTRWPLIATSNEPSYHGTNSIDVSWCVKAFISASVNDSVCGS